MTLHAPQAEAALSPDNGSVCEHIRHLGAAGLWNIVTLPYSNWRKASEQAKLGK